MNDDDYTRLLLESSFKESNLFWIWNGAFLVAQSVLFGLAGGRDSEPETALVFSILGIFLAFLHLRVLKISQYYNHTWFDAVRSWVNAKAKRGPAGVEVGKSYSDLQGILVGLADPSTKNLWGWVGRLRVIPERFRNLFYPKRATDLMYCIPVLFLAGWGFLAGLAIRTILEILGITLVVQLTESLHSILIS